MPMPVTAPPIAPVPNFWNAYGHSYLMYAYGTRTPAGRSDSIFRNLMNVDHTSWRNFAVVGSRVVVDGASQGGWVRPMSTILGVPPGAYSMGAPYVSQGGAYLLCWGTNDLGVNGNTPQMNAAYTGVMTAIVSRCRCSIVHLANATTTIAYAGGFSTSGSDNAAWIDASSNGFVAFGSTLGATITITLPSDYNGEVVTIGFVTEYGTNGGTVTYSGTAGVTGTTYTGNTMPALFSTLSYMVRRITTLTAANAGQTIIMTISSLDSGGTVIFDGWWLEADNPPPVLVPNIPRLPYPGYTGYTFTLTASGLSGTAVSSTPSTITLTNAQGTVGIAYAGTVTIPSAGGTVTITYTSTTTTTLVGCTASGGSGNYSSNTMTSSGPTDSDVLTLNGAMVTAMGVFDDMVQIVDIDTALAKNAAWFAGDGVHPNDIGAARVADALAAALKRCVPNTPWGTAASLEQASQRTCAIIRPAVTTNWYPPDANGGPGNGTAYTLTAGDWWAVPFMLTQAWLRWMNWAVDLITNSSNPSVYIALYDDRNFTGYPCQLFQAAANTSGTPLPLTSTGPQVSSSTLNANGNVTLCMDPGLYWLVLGISVAGTATMRTSKGPSQYVRQFGANMANITGAPCGYKLTGQGTGALLPTFPPGATPSDNAPVIGMYLL
jgi:hypothetical protein